MNATKLDLRLEPDQIAQWVYEDPAYPAAYKTVVAESYAKKDQYLQIVSHIPLPKQKGECITVLEAGPSNVPLLKNALHSAGFPVEQYRLLGLDPYLRMHPPELEMLTGSITAIPLEEHSVDVVVISSVLFFVTNRAQSIAECRRVLKPGGLLILSEPDIQTAPLLSQKVMQYEAATIRRRTVVRNPGWLGKLLYPFALAQRFIPRLLSLSSTVQINKRIYAQQKGAEGFTEDELKHFLKNADISLITSERTYADSYFLLVGSTDIC